MISEELSKLIDDALQKYLDKKRLTCKYKYNDIEKGMFIEGFKEGFLMGRVRSKSDIKGKTKKELKKRT